MDSRKEVMVECRNFQIVERMDDAVAKLYNVRVDVAGLE